MTPEQLERLILGELKPDEVARETGLDERLCQVAGALASSQAFNNDLFPLVRQFLRSKSLRDGAEVTLHLPLRDGLPAAAEWRNWGVEPLIFPGRVSLTASRWIPSWLDNRGQDPFDAVFAGEQRRPPAEVPIDPFAAEATGYSFYSCPGQREAVLAAFLMPERSTLLVNLPTGSGKSLVGQLPSLAQARAGGLTILVVPTVALAIDQERQMVARLTTANVGSWQLAWHSGTSATHRREIRERLRSGTQRILITSPEALLTSLISDVIDVASNGMLSYLVIDEAHLVSSWGVEFRPAFQALAALRQTLLDVAPASGFRTLLLSATFSEESVELLGDLFGPKNSVQMVSAVHLRPEPEYWMSYCQSPAQKEQRIAEILRFAPRPIILYVTKKEDARTWKRRIGEALNLTRVEKFDGDTPSTERKRIIDDWTDNRLDIIVATAAFGVGMDKGDVRTVVHATIPETLDRFYQEVGRGGRDGRAAASVLIYEQTDWRLPENMARPKLISDELGFNRWKALFDLAAPGPDELFAVDLHAVPIHQTGSSDYNVAWNLRTLLMMRRSGMIDLRLQRRDEASATDDLDLERDITSTATLGQLRVRVQDHGHLRRDNWESRVAPIRQQTIASAERSFSLLQRLLQQRSEVGDTLAELYSIRGSWETDVTKVCAGCPSDRWRGDDRGYHPPSAAGIARVDGNSLGNWSKRFPWIDPEHAIIFYENSFLDDATGEAVLRLMKWLVAECGIQEIATSAKAGAWQEPWRRLHRFSASGALLAREIDDATLEPYSPLRRVSIYEETPTSEAIRQVRLLRRPFHLIVTPFETPDPFHPGRKLNSTAQHSATLSQLLASIDQ